MATARSTAATPISIDEFNTLVSNSNHDHLTDAIVSALGGIDKVLSEYIRITREHENEDLLTRSEIQRIADIISAAPTAPAESMYDKLYERAKLMNNTFHLKTSDTVWHSIFAALNADRNFADRLNVALFSKSMMTIVALGDA